MLSACCSSRGSKELDLSFYKFGQCKDNAKIALELNLIKAEGLHMVAGSLGLNNHYEYGGKNWTHNNFKSRGFKDAHVWIEDKEGRIYDYIDPMWSECCKSFRVKVTFPKNGYTIAGMEPKELADKFKITYIPAEPRTQELIIKSLGIEMLLIEPSTGKIEKKQLTAKQLLSMVYKIKVPTDD